MCNPGYTRLRLTSGNPVTGLSGGTINQATPGTPLEDWLHHKYHFGELPFSQYFVKLLHWTEN